MFKTVAEDYTLGAIRDINNFNYELDGSFTRIIPDCGTNFDVSLLSPGEVFLPAAEKYFTEKEIPEEEWFIANFKYPKIHTREFGYDRVIPLKEFITRIKSNNELSEHQQSLLTQIVEDTSTGVIMVPAFELNKNKHAGMDYDYDGMSSIFDQGFVNFLKDLPSLAVFIMT